MKHERIPWGNMQIKPHFPYRKIRFKREAILVVKDMKTDRLFTFPFAEISTRSQTFKYFTHPISWGWASIVCCCVFGVLNYDLLQKQYIWYHNIIKYKYPWTNVQLSRVFPNVSGGGIWIKQKWWLAYPWFPLEIYKIFSKYFMLIST